MNGVQIGAVIASKTLPALTVRQRIGKMNTIAIVPRNPLIK